MKRSSCCIFISPAPQASSSLRSAVWLASIVPLAGEDLDLVSRSVFSLWCPSFPLWEGERAGTGLRPPNSTDLAPTPKKGGPAQACAGRWARAQCSEHSEQPSGEVPATEWVLTHLGEGVESWWCKPTLDDICGFLALEARPWDRPLIYRRGNVLELLETWWNWQKYMKLAIWVIIIDDHCILRRDANLILPLSPQGDGGGWKNLAIVHGRTKVIVESNHLSTESSKIGWCWISWISWYT